MGALNQARQAVTSFVQDPVGSTSNALAKADKDLSLSQNAVPIVTIGTLAATGGLSGIGIPGLSSLGGAGATSLAGYDAIAGLTAGGAAGGAAAAAGGAGLLGTALNWAKANPGLALTGAGLAANALGGSGSTPSSSTASTSIDPDLKAAYLQQLADARAAAAGLGTRQFEGFTPGYATAEQQLTATGIGGTGQQTTSRAAELALAEAGYTPQQIAAATGGTAGLASSQGYTAQQIAAAQANRAGVQNIGAGTGAQFMGAYQNPYETQVVQATLADIERQRQISQQAQQARAVGARAFGGSRQAVAESIANEDYMRQAANTAAQLRSAGFTTAAGLGQTDAARALQAQMANQGVDLTLEQANAQLRQQGMLANQSAGNQALQFGAGASNQAALANQAAMNQMAQFNAQLAQQAALANQSAYAQGSGIRQGAIGQLGALGAQQQNLGMTGAQAVMTAEQQRQQLAQARLDAARNLAAERLGLTGSALGQQVPNLGASTTTPIYNNPFSSGLGGALGGARLGQLLGGNENPDYAGYGALLGGLLGYRTRA